jgi:hypothetical protein
MAVYLHVLDIHYQISGVPSKLFTAFGMNMGAYFIKPSKPNSMVRSSLESLHWQM